MWHGELTNVHVYIYTYIYICTYIDVYACVHVHVFVYIYVCVYCNDQLYTLKKAWENACTDGEI